MQTQQQHQVLGVRPGALLTLAGGSHVEVADYGIDEDDRPVVMLRNVTKHGNYKGEAWPMRLTALRANLAAATQRFARGMAR
jgi:hypothetical protein